jgi:hypothetical protein
MPIRGSSAHRPTGLDGEIDAREEADIEAGVLRIFCQTGVGKKKLFLWAPLDQRLSVAT